MDDDDKATGEIETGEREMPIETKVRDSLSADARV
jgi:hypothetical protein